MKNLPLLLILVFSTTLLSAQDYKIEGTVVAAQSKTSIPYVNIGIKKLAIGTVSDDNGKFKLKISELSDTITFSAIGYETKQILASHFMEEMVSVELTEKAYGIEAIEVSAQRFDGEERRFGVKNETRGKSIAYGNGQLGTQIGAIIRIKKPTYIKSANFALNHAKGDSMFFRVNIYAYRNSKVGENLLKENILIAEKQKKGTISLDLTKYNIVLDSDVMLSLEWIKNDSDNGNEGITFDTKKPKKAQKPGGTYLKTSSASDFRKAPFPVGKRKPCFYFIGKQAKK